jgi:hypothetical protein
MPLGQPAIGEPLRSLLLRVRLLLSSDLSPHLSFQIVPGTALDQRLPVPHLMRAQPPYHCLLHRPAGILRELGHHVSINPNGERPDGRDIVSKRLWPSLLEHLVELLHLGVMHLPLLLAPAAFLAWRCSEYTGRRCGDLREGLGLSHRRWRRNRPGELRWDSGYRIV